MVIILDEWIRLVRLKSSNMTSKSFFYFIFMLVFFACQKEQGSEERNVNTYYQEQHRPQYHFSPEAKWMNDPNGMVYFDGEYHLFYQYYPDSTVWGPMHWGHAVSKDLVQWEHLPIALYPDSLGYIFSGSAVVDWKNTSGLGTADAPALLAFYTYHDPVGANAGKDDFQYQAMAYSNDRGRTWTKYEGNPVVPNPGIRDFRDPKVIWDDDSNQWLMVFAAWDHVKIYGSQDLKSWNHLSDFGREWGIHTGVWECPDLFPIRVEGSEEKKWILLQSINPGHVNGGSGTQYFVGQFDGTNFILEEDFAKAVRKIAASIPAGKIFQDFENGYGDWKTEGNAFGNAPATSKLPNQHEVEGYEGKAFVNSFNGGDLSTGTLTSPEFIIKQDFINFKIGGGNDQVQSAMHLLLNGEKVRSATGTNNEKLRWHAWDVSDLQGQKAVIQLVDTHTGGWGHINVDQIMFADTAAIPATENAVWLDYGRDNYAGVTWSNAPDHRRIFIGWMSNWNYAQVVPTALWRSAMTLARDLTLVQTEKGLRLRTKMVRELNAYHGKLTELLPKEVNGQLDITEELLFSPTQQEANLVFEWEEGTTPDFGIQLSNDNGELYRMGYDAANDQYYSDRIASGKTGFSAAFAQKKHAAPRFSNGNSLQMQVFFDRASAELLADEGMVAITDIFFPNEDYNKIAIYSNGGKVKLSKGNFQEMKRAISAKE